MAANQPDLPITTWIEEGKNKKATYLLVVLNAKTNGYEPIYVMPGESLKQKEKKYSTGWYSVLTNYQI